MLKTKQKSNVMHGHKKVCVAAKVLENLHFYCFFGGWFSIKF